MRIVSGSLDRTIKVNTSQFARCLPLYLKKKVWGVSNLECLHTMDWMSGEGHTGVVRCLQVKQLLWVYCMLARH